ncbi:MAG TPA: cytochrome d ubiquinol oxidase subunit II, partial [Chloroflexia bacterium]|nr:cytochrome d ubiquinol oxidase subunit II [Chloroflexia bacterium]
ALTAYVVLAGADFGGGVWQVLAFGPRKEEQRKAIARAMGPVWEANHVWLILVVVLLFSAFPSAFSAIMTALFFPLTLALVGITLRGSAFVFRAHASQAAGAQRYLGNIFGGASIITPVLLGMSVGALGSGQIRVQNDRVNPDYVTPWLSPFPVMVGLLALALCAFLAAVYLTCETEGELRQDFRKRALWAGFSMALLAFIALPFTMNGAPLLWEDLSWGRSTPLVIGMIVLGLGALVVFWLGHYNLARIMSIGEVACIVWGWAVAQAPYIVVPDLTITGTASPQATLQALVIVLAVGSLVLLPSLWLLFAVFKGKNPAVDFEDEH